MQERLPLEHPGPQPCPQQLQHAPIGDPFADELQQDLAVERIEEAAESSSVFLAPRDMHRSFPQRRSTDDARLKR